MAAQRKQPGQSDVVKWVEFDRKEWQEGLERQKKHKALIRRGIKLGRAQRALDPVAESDPCDRLPDDVSTWRPKYVSLPATLALAGTGSVAFAKFIEDRPDRDSMSTLSIICWAALFKLPMRMQSNKLWPKVRDLIADEKIEAEGIPSDVIGNPNDLHREIRRFNGKLPSGDVRVLTLSDSGTSIGSSIKTWSCSRMADGSGTTSAAARLMCFASCRLIPARVEARSQPQPLRLLQHQTGVWRGQERQSQRPERSQSGANASAAGGRGRDFLPPWI